MVKTTQDWNERHKTMLFVDDAPDGGCIVQCPCGYEFNEKDKTHCPSCKEELLYPGWASW